jgi:hypothetical protein
MWEASPIGVIRAYSEPDPDCDCDRDCDRDCDCDVAKEKGPVFFFFFLQGAAMAMEDSVQLVLDYMLWSQQHGM